MAKKIPVTVTQSESVHGGPIARPVAVRILCTNSLPGFDTGPAITLHGMTVAEHESDSDREAFLTEFARLAAR